MTIAVRPGREETVSEPVSEPGAVAMGSQNQAALHDPVATAPGSDTLSERLGSGKHFRAKNSMRGPRHIGVLDDHTLARLAANASPDRAILLLRRHRNRNSYDGA